MTWKVPGGYGSHALDAGDTHRDVLKGLCGFNWSQREGRIVEDLPSCLECLREVQLGADRPRGGWG